MSAADSGCFAKLARSLENPFPDILKSMSHGFAVSGHVLQDLRVLFGGCQRLREVAAVPVIPAS